MTPEGPGPRIKHEPSEDTSREGGKELDKLSGGIILELHALI